MDSTIKQNLYITYVLKFNSYIYRVGYIVFLEAEIYVK